MHTPVLLSASAIALLLCSACIESEGALPSTAEQLLIDRYVMHEAPTPMHRLEIHYGDRATLVGYDVGDLPLQPGTFLGITWYWRVEKPLGDNWKLFTHVSDETGLVRVNADKLGPVRKDFPPSKWPVGKYIRDPQLLGVKKPWASDKASLHVGFWNGKKRLSMTRKDGVAASTAQAVLAVKDAASPPELKLHKALQRPTIDGRLDDQLWGRSESTGAFINTVTGGAASLKAKVRAGWDAQRLYLAFEVSDGDLRGPLKGRDAHLWKQDCVELMLDPDGDGRDYFELQVSPTGEVFDTRYRTRRRPGPFGETGWNAALERGVTTQGTPDDGKPDSGYTVELALPWSALRSSDGKSYGPPALGDRWRANFYVMDRHATGQRAAGWAPTLVRDFHVPKRFGQLRFADPEGQVPTTPTAAGTTP